MEPSTRTGPFSEYGCRIAILPSGDGRTINLVSGSVGSNISEGEVLSQGTSTASKAKKRNPSKESSLTSGCGETPGKENGNIRHCAYCLVSIPEEKVKVCGKCHKRAYCSRNCQKLDWRLCGEGQEHKKWCGVDFGEEDLDWKVAPVAGKGLGLIAMRAFPALSRIIVDPCRDVNHPRAKDLEPTEMTVKKKFMQNCLHLYGKDFPQENHGGLPKKVLCFRIARANHSCDANASHFNDNNHHVKILFSNRDIAEGEEICMNYIAFTDLRWDIPASKSRESLETIWGIVCPADCTCYNSQILKAIKECHELEEQINDLACANKLDPALKLLEELLKKHDEVHPAWEIKAHYLFFGFQMAIIRKKTFDLAQKFINESYAIYSAIFHPKSDSVKKYAKYKKDFATNSFYLKYGTEFR